VLWMKNFLYCFNRNSALAAIPWNRVSDTLSLKFRAATGRALTPENLQFLAEKAFRGTFTDPNQCLTWAQFCKEPLPERNFTFWEWFYQVMKLTREHLRGPWVDGLILGFIHKKHAEDMLRQCPNGTFLLRFSDSESGGITIAWISDTNEIFMLQPFTHKDFAIRSLADRINDLSNLVYLYPDITKDAAFSKYYTPYQDNQPATNNGYVKPVLVTHIPGYSQNQSYNNTPNHPFLSPDVTRDTPSVASSYAGSVVMPSGTSAGGGVADFMEPFEDLMDYSGLATLNDLMPYRQ